MQMHDSELKLKRLHIDTYKDPVIYLNKDSAICHAEGIEARARVRVCLKDKEIIATVNVVNSNLLAANEASLSEHAWKLLDAAENDNIIVTHPKPTNSLTYIRRKIFGNNLTASMSDAIIKDTINGKLSDIHIAAFITACSGYNMDEEEIYNLTNSMVKFGEVIEWGVAPIVDKHCIGGLPGNRTTLIVVPIIAACGLLMPKTSSRAITSPAGTADVMEVFAPVSLGIKKMQQVVQQQGGCIVWGDASNLSPADDLLIRVERALNIDGEGQMVASILSKKISAGSSHVVIDIPVGPTAKVRTKQMAAVLQKYLVNIGKRFNLKIAVMLTNGNEPIGNGIGPALEAKDVTKVLQNQGDAPIDLKNKALAMAAEILRLSGKSSKGDSMSTVASVLESGKAWEKFQQICKAQGGFFEPKDAKHTCTIESKRCGNIISINNRSLARVAKLAGAPQEQVAGIYLHNKVNSQVSVGEPLFTIHANSKGELKYAMSALEDLPEIFTIEEPV